jgi:endonuclease/exonuclease/phosphatase family metal-dependent hydrolase
MPISLTGNYTQNFDTLPGTGTGLTWTNDLTLDGWYLFRQPAPGTAVTAYAADDGGGNSGSFYSYGSSGSSDRALGGLGSGGAYFGSPASGAIAGWIAFGATNSTGNTLSSFSLSFNGEQWRNSNTTPQSMVLEYGFGTSFDSVTTWTASGGNFDWTSPVATATAGAVNGNTAGQVSGRGGTVSGVTWADGQTLWIRWVERNDAGNDHGLAIDDFTLTLSSGPAPTVPTVTIAATDADAAESGITPNPGTFRITRTGDTTATLAIAYTVAGTATNGIDYNGLSGTVTIPAGESFVDLVITPVNDARVEGSETLTLNLTDTAAYDLGTAAGATITIADNTTGTLRRVGGFVSAVGAEIPAFDPVSDRLFVVAGSTVEILSVSNTGALSLSGTLSPGFIPPAGTEAIPNSVAVRDGIVAVAYAVRNITTGAQLAGRVSFFNVDGTFLNSVEVGFLPDMLTFTPDGRKVLTANEGEPNSYGQSDSVDPEGSVSIIDLSGSVANATVQTAGFTSFNSQIAALRAAGVRIIGPGATVAQDLEPEYIAFSADGQTALVTLQENNALAEVNIATATVTRILPLGAKDHSLAGNGLDASDRDGLSNTGRINIQNWPVFGLYQPDAIASFSANGQTYYITANEGDARDYRGFSEETRVGASGYALDPTVFPNAAALKQTANLGRLNVTNATGDTDGDRDFDRIEAFGSRSFSIWDGNGNRVFDSGDQLEQITVVQVPSFYNSNGSFSPASGEGFDTRSDNKGPEPEGVVVGVVNGRTYAFIGLERTGDVIVYDVTNPTAPSLVEYINVPDDVGVEGLTFISAADSPTGKPLVVTSNEISRTTAVFEFTPPTPINVIQGTAHRSPLVGQTVTTRGIVTAVVATGSGRGFYLQDPNPDNNAATSEAIFVFLGSSTIANPTVGQSVQVSGRVDEFRPGSNVNNLTITQINGTVAGGTVTAIASLGSIAPTIIGEGGRVPPNQTIASATGNVEASGYVFNPAMNGIDFYESLEGMVVQVNNGFTTSPTNDFGEIWVLADGGKDATGRTARGGSLISSTDFNPERIQIDDDLIRPASPSPNVNVGARLNSVTGVVSYNFNNYEVLATSAITVADPGTLQKEVTALNPFADRLTVASFNLENLGGNAADSRFDALANRIVNNLKAPDVLSVEEIQDNDGATNSGVVDAEVTYRKLIAAIQRAGGPTYEFRQVNPVNNQDGGQPGGNIRVGFLFNPQRVQYVDRPGGTSTTATTVNNLGGDPQLSFSPGRLDPTNPAFTSSRKPLAGEFLFNGHKVFVVGNHWNSKGGDQPLFGPNQPPTLTTEAQRRQQAQVVNDFVDSVLAIDSTANILVMGDLNDFQFSEPLNILRGIPGGVGTPVLQNLVDTLPANERYTYNFQGNAQVLDHILASNPLMNNLDAFDVVHFNSEFFDQDSDHDPNVARFVMPRFLGTDRRDTFVGTARNEVIVGGFGGDMLTGGGGSDRFVYENIRDAGDTITDFTPGVDKIVLTRLLDSIVVGGYNGINAIADNLVSFVARGADTIIRVDQNGQNNASAGRNLLTLQGVSVAAANNPVNFVF